MRRTLVALVLTVIAVTGVGASSASASTTAEPRPVGQWTLFVRTLADTVDHGTVTDAQWERLQADGWHGVPGDGAERLYRPGAAPVLEPLPPALSGCLDAAAEADVTVQAQRIDECHRLHA